MLLQRQVQKSKSDHHEYKGMPSVFVGNKIGCGVGMLGAVAQVCSVRKMAKEGLERCPYGISRFPRLTT